MKTSTYKRMQQSSEDWSRSLKEKVEAAFTAAQLTWQPGVNPVNPDERTAWEAGFQRGCHWAWQSACRGEKLNERFDLADSTAAGGGEQDGWNAAAKALGAT